MTFFDDFAASAADDDYRVNPIVRAVVTFVAQDGAEHRANIKLTHKRNSPDGCLASEHCDEFRRKMADEFMNAVYELTG